MFHEVAKNWTQSSQEHLVNIPREMLDQMKFPSFPKTTRFLNVFEGHLTAVNILGRKMEGLKSPTPLEL
jgi:hypothetical protein